MTEIRLILFCILLHNCYLLCEITLRKTCVFQSDISISVIDEAGSILWHGNCSSDPTGGGMKRAKGEHLAYPFVCCAMYSQENELLPLLSFPSPG